MKKTVVLVIVYFYLMPAVICAEKTHYFGIAAGSPNLIFGGLEYDDAEYRAGAGFSGSDFSLTFDKIYKREYYKLDVYGRDFPVRIGWGCRFTNSYHPQFGLRAVLYLGHRLRKGHELFIQVSPLYRFLPSYGINLDWSVGLRFGELWAK